MRHGLGSVVACVAAALAGASSLVACSAATVAPRTSQRDVVVARTIRFEGLPNGARLVEERAAPEGRVVRANRVQGAVDLPFVFRAHESVHNGSATRTEAKAESVTVSIQAAGHLPKLVQVSLSSPATVDAHLEKPALAHVAVAASVEADLDVALERLLSGRCSEATRALAAARAAATDPGDVRRIDDLAGACVEASPLMPLAARSDPAAVGVPQGLSVSPMAAIEAVRAVMVTEHDEPGRAGLDRMLGTVSAGRLNEAARLAALVAGPLPARRAAIVLRLPTSMMAATRLVRAQSARRDQDPRLAMELAVEARHLDPLVGRSVYDEIRAERAEALRMHAAELERDGNGLLARAYWVALAALVGGSSDAARGLVTTLPAAMAAVSVRLAVAPAREDPSVGRLTGLLAQTLPRHIALVSLSDRPDAVLSYLAAAPERSFRVSKSYRSKAVIIGKVPTENPNYEIAQNEVVDAQSALEQARENYRQLHEQAQQNARRAASAGGGWGSAFAGVAGLGEGAGIAMVKGAEGRLADARRNLQQTPRTTLEEVEDQVRFPVLQIDASAVTRLWLRLDGLGDPVEEKGEATASASAEQIAAAPTIGVNETRPDVAKLSSLTPDVDPVLSEAVARLGRRVRAFEEEHAWSAFVALRDAGSVEPAATAAIDYLSVAGESAPHRPEIAEFLVRSLP